MQSDTPDYRTPTATTQSLVTVPAVVVPGKVEWWEAAVVRSNKACSHDLADRPESDSYIVSDQYWPAGHHRIQ